MRTEEEIRAKIVQLDERASMLNRVNKQASGSENTIAQMICVIHQFALQWALGEVTSLEVDRPIEEGK